MDVLVLHPQDNVAVATRDVTAGQRVGPDSLLIADDIPTGHKFARSDVVKGAPIVKYGQAIGVTTSAIPAGRHVHTQNVNADIVSGLQAVPVSQAKPAATAGDRTFDGYQRADGRAGTRNFIGVVSTVNCSATVVRQIAAQFTPSVLENYKYVDGVFPIAHATGCGMSAKGPGIDLLRRTLGGYLSHPNMGGVLVIGLGCEVNDVTSLLDSANLIESQSLRTMSIQATGGTRAAIERGIKIVHELLAVADRERRQPLPVAKLSLGLQCGGSDSFSGISANPALGYGADILVQAGGTVILSETPEIHGAEHLLLSRAASPVVADALRERVEWWERYVAMHGESLDNNPSPGNIKGGITTILEKSLGAVMKSGTSPLQAVYAYAERISDPGFVFMDSPGFDPCSITGEIASGANIVCFTTGRGSVFGAKPVPSIKLATNSAMAARMPDDIDYDCGAILSGDLTLVEAGDEIFRLVVETASGRRSASELNGLGDFEFVPWQMGAVL